MKIKKIEVLVGVGSVDTVYVYIEGRYPFPGHNEIDPYLKAETPIGKGAEWAQETFGVRPVVINTKMELNEAGVRRVH